MQENKASDFKNLTDYIDKHVLDMNQVLCMNIALDIYSNGSNTLLPATLRKRRSRLKEKLIEYYGKKILVLKYGRAIIQDF